MSDTIENNIQKSGLATLDLEEIKPSWEVTGFDLAPVLWEGLVLKEKDFRDFLKDNDWSVYNGNHVYIFCSTEAIIPTWAYMLLTDALRHHASLIHIGEEAGLIHQLWLDFISKFDVADYKDKRVVVKGCGDEAIPNDVYAQLSSKLLPVVKSLMFGEPCATVPVFKRP